MPIFNSFYPELAKVDSFIWKINRKNPIFNQTSSVFVGENLVYKYTIKNELNQ